MDFQSVNHIITARHMSPDGTAKGYYRYHAQQVQITRGVRLDMSSLDAPRGNPVRARIERGQWIADCECNGASFVDPDFPVFFCFSCGNRANGGAARPVAFPANYREIEKALLDRPVDDLRGLTDAERAGLAQPLIFVEGKGGLGRDWNPDESLEDLLAQQTEPVRKWRKALKAGK